MTAERELERDLREILERVIGIADPDRVILFGSAARGDADAHSDIDLLVVKANIPHRGRMTEDIYVGLLGVRRAVDAVVVDAEDLRKYGDAHALIIRPALREGRVIYERPSRA
ncbi:MAG: nucleotidyltransferase domain-containing protein [Candidatus Bipolaricaulota bacterium]